MAEKVDIFMPFYVADYLADTTDLSTEEHGAYVLLLLTSWRSEGVLPNDPRRLARIAKVPFERWPDIWGAIGRFFDVSDATVSQGRLLEEREKALRLKQASSDGGKRSANARRAKHGTSQPPSNPLRTPFEPPSEGSPEAKPEVSPNISESPSESEKEVPLPAPAIPGHVVLTGPGIAQLFGRIRSQFYGGMEWAGAGPVRPETSARAAEMVNATVGGAATVAESLRRFWVSVKSGDHPATREIVTKGLPFAFACWLGQYPTDHEEIIGVAPAKPPAPVGARAGPRAPAHEQTHAAAARALERSRNRP